MPRTPILADLHRRWQAGHDPLRTRKQEDVRALELLGAAYRHLSLADCAYRQVKGEALYPSEASLFGDIHPSDYAFEALSTCDLLDRARPDVIYLPLAVGQHVDHQIVRRWGLTLVEEHRDALQFRFYAEYPYSRFSGVADALQQINLPLRMFTIQLDEAAVEAKIRAIGCYQSQISTFWADLQHMREDVRRASTDVKSGQLFERYWVIEDAQSASG